jgi:hydrogenase expression/formation protein HypC
MCLAVPGRIVSVRQASDDAVMGRLGAVDFQGSRVDVSLAMTPQADVGDWVLVHAGFAISVLDAEEARQTWDYLQAAEGAAGPPDRPPGAGP